MTHSCKCPHTERNFLLRFFFDFSRPVCFKRCFILGIFLTRNIPVILYLSRNLHMNILLRKFWHCKDIHVCRLYRTKSAVKSILQSYTHFSSIIKENGGSKSPLLQKRQILTLIALPTDFQKLPALTVTMPHPSSYKS